MDQLAATCLATGRGEVACAAPPASWTQKNGSQRSPSHRSHQDRRPGGRRPVALRQVGVPQRDGPPSPLAVFSFEEAGWRAPKRFCWIRASSWGAASLPARAHPLRGLLPHIAGSTARWPSTVFLKWSSARFWSMWHSKSVTASDGRRAIRRPGTSTRWAAARSRPNARGPNVSS